MWEDVPTFFNYGQMGKIDIYIDESGDFSAYSNNNPLYTIAFVLVNSSSDNHSPISKFTNNLSNLICGDFFVHIGNLVRGEKPYKDISREDRWKLFYALHSFARYSKYNYFISSTVKGLEKDELINSITKSLIKIIDENYKYLNQYDEIILHYDCGQAVLTGLLSACFISKFNNCKMIKTTQSQSPFMQLADLYAYFELLSYKISKSYLTNSEEKFFGGIKNLRKNYISCLDDKRLTKNTKY